MIFCEWMVRRTPPLTTPNRGDSVTLCNFRSDWKVPLSFPRKLETDLSSVLSGTGHDR